MKKVKITFMNLFLATMMALPSMAQKSSAYIHEATPSSIINSKTMLDTADLNGNSNLILLSTHNYNPNGATGIYVDKAIGFRFQSLKWYIINQDNSAFIANSFYNVFIPGTDAYTWVHSSTNANTSNNYTIIDDGRINNNPNAKVFVENVLANYNNKVNGIYYNTGLNKWCIYNQAGSGDDMAENLDFNIIVPNGNTGYEHFVHTATANNTSNHFTYINNPDANNNPDAIIFITQIWNPGGTANGVYNNHHVGVQYRTSNNKWVIYNEDLDNMPTGASFNVMVFKNNTIGVDEIEISKKDAQLYPNPISISDNISVALNQNLSGKIEFSVYSISGELMQIEEFNKQLENQNASFAHQLKPGMYMIKIENKGKVGVQKLIVY